MLHPLLRADRVAGKVSIGVMRPPSRARLLVWIGPGPLSPIIPWPGPGLVPGPKALKGDWQGSGRDARTD